MSNTENEIQKDVEFLQTLKSNQAKVPNDFTLGMGKLIKQAREDLGINQVEFAKSIKRRPATISDIENGKSEIGVMTLVLFAITLRKPISYFFPESVLKDIVSDVKTPFEHRMLEIAREVKAIGDQSLALDLLDVLLNHFENPEEMEVES